LNQGQLEIEGLKSENKKFLKILEVSEKEVAVLKADLVASCANLEKNAKCSQSGIW
jgi:hypothetical protein